MIGKTISQYRIIEKLSGGCCSAGVPTRDTRKREADVAGGEGCYAPRG